VPNRRSTFLNERRFLRGLVLKGATMPKKTKLTRQPWSKDDLKVLKTMAKAKAGRDKIAKSLKRTPGAVVVRASMLGVSLSTR
jgi:hypothetical protein